MQDDSPSGASKSISRRAVIGSIAGMAAASAMPEVLMGLEKPAPLPGSINPRWFGFNLMEYFSTDADWMNHFPYKNDGIFPEDDFKWMSDWGFNFVRLPMDYRFWTDPNDLLKVNEKMIEPIDRAIRLGEKYGVHVTIGLHRAPGFCILDGNDDQASGIHIKREKTSVYRDQGTLDAFIHQWVYFARRYKGISNAKVTFNLVNEPIDVKWTQPSSDLKDYIRVVRAAVSGIRAEDPTRLIVTDGYDAGRTPIPELYDTGILQSGHDYSPVQLTHYHCAWARPASMTWPLPTWPLKDASGKVIADRETLAAEVAPWKDLAKRGIPIHFGETGCNRYTPPKVYYAWLSDMLDVINDLKCGWAFWNFRGVAGPLDPDRPGTEYKNWHGHKLDFKMLNIIQSKLKS